MGQPEEKTRKKTKHNKHGSGRQTTNTLPNDSSTDMHTVQVHMNIANTDYDVFGTQISETLKKNMKSVFFEHNDEIRNQ